MSYVSTVLSFSPVAFWYLNQALTSEGMVDLSGNDFHGIFRSEVTLGQASPIETDATSRSAASDVGYYYNAEISGSPLDVRDAFTLIAWGYNDGVAWNKTLLSRRAGPAFGGYTGIDIGSGDLAHGSVSVGGTDYTLTATLGEIPVGHFPMLALVRNGTSLLLYQDAILVAQRADLPGGSIVEAGYNDGGWKVGYGNASGSATSGATGSVWNAAKTCAVSIHPTGLSANNIRDIYEAAKASLPLRATIVINLGLELNTDQIQPVNFAFAHNFSDTFGSGDAPITETLEYKTNVNQSEPDYQQRVSARPHGALRTLEYHLSPASAAARSRLQGSLYAPGQFYCLPVWSDSGVLTGTATSGTNTVSLDTTKRDYEVGSYVGFCSDLQDPLTYQFYKITAVSDTQLTLESNISTTVASGSPVFPARIVSISEDTLAVKSFAADHEDTAIRFDVIESELSTRRITAYTASTTYKSIEVFTLETAKVSFRDDRPYDIQRRIQAHGRDYQWAMDTGSPQTFPVRFLLKDRDSLSQFYGWLDARLGKLNPLWVSTKEQDLIPLAVPSNHTMTVKKSGFSFQQGRRDLEILKTDNSFVRARVTAVSDNGNGTETWTTSDNLPTLVTISKVSFLKFCTLAADTLTIRYFKGGSNGAVIATCDLNFKELLTSPA